MKFCPLNTLVGAITIVASVILIRATGVHPILAALMGFAIGYWAGKIWPPIIFSTSKRVGFGR